MIRLHQLARARDLVEIAPTRSWGSSQLEGVFYIATVSCTRGVKSYRTVSYSCSARVVSVMRAGREVALALVPAREVIYDNRKDNLRGRTARRKRS